MKIYIPEIGDELILTEDWSFYLVLERRNKGLLDIMFPGFQTGVYNFYDWMVSDIWPDSEGYILKKMAFPKSQTIFITRPSP